LNTFVNLTYPLFIMSTDKELYKLELLSLVAQVSQELFNHTKLQDKNLAEFVIAVSTWSFLHNLILISSFMSKANRWRSFRPSLAKSVPIFPSGS